jgi:cytochrome P450
LRNVASTGQSEAVFEEMHAKFNTKALRIAPNELHITDASLYKTVYSQTQPFLKEPLLYDAFMVPTTLFAEQVPSLHKERRKMLNPLFSRQGMTKLEPVITSTVEVFMRKVRKLAKKGPINVFDAYRYLSH